MVKVLKSSKARAFDVIIMTPATPKQANVKKRFILATPERSGSGCERGQPCSKICRSPPAPCGTVLQGLPGVSHVRTLVHMLV